MRHIAPYLAYKDKLIGVMACSIKKDFFEKAAGPWKKKK